MPPPSILWLRRDLRRADLPALGAAHAAARAEGGPGEVAVLFVLDTTLWSGAGDARRAWLAESSVSVAVIMAAELEESRSLLESVAHSAPRPTTTTSPAATARRDPQRSTRRRRRIETGAIAGTSASAGEEAPESPSAPSSSASNAARARAR